MVLKDFRILKGLLVVRASLRPWLYFVILYYFPIIPFTIIINVLIPIVFPSYKNIYNIPLYHPQSLLGNSIFNICRSLLIISLVIINKDLNEKNRISPKINQIFFGFVIAIFLPFFEIILPYILSKEGVSFLLFKSILSSINKIILVIFSLFIRGISIPIQEEIIFRGILQRKFKDIAGTYKAIAYTSICFVIAHIEAAFLYDQGILYLFYVLLISLLLCLVREKYENLSFCFAFHIVVNSFYLILDIFFNQKILPIEIKEDF